MRGDDTYTQGLFNLKKIDDFVPMNHPLWGIRQPHSNETNASSTGPDSKLYRKDKTTSELRFMGHTLMENRRRA